MKIKIGILLVAVMLLLSGCSLWMDGDYVSVKPHTADGSQQQQEAVAVQDYLQLRSVLADMVASGTESGMIIVETLNKNRLDSYMQNAITYVTESTPIGAYAVSEIRYDIGSVTGTTAIAVNVSYSLSLAELRRIPQVADNIAAQELIETALNQCDAGLVFQIKNFEDMDFVQYVQDFALENPSVVMEMPQVNVEIFPETGNNRVISLRFVYQSSRESLREMQNYVRPIFASALLYVSGEGEEGLKFSWLYSFLMERNTYTVETSITPAYSLLRHGVGDSRAFATVYASMCRRAGLDARTVTGTRAGEPWYWNIICENGQYYHVDLLQSQSSGGYRKLKDADMNGYVWDYAAYPACE